MKARVGPVGYAGNQPVFQRIQMHIVDVMSVITLILNQVLPIAPLPDAALAARALGYRPYLRLRLAPGKRELDGLPAQGESASPSGSVQTQCIWSGRTTQASIWNGWRECVARTVSRSRSIWRTSTSLRRLSRLTVKKYVAPGTWARRYRDMAAHP